MRRPSRAWLDPSTDFLGIKTEFVPRVLHAELRIGKTTRFERRPDGGATLSPLLDGRRVLCCGANRRSVRGVARPALHERAGG